jgi:ribonuclease HI
MLKLYTDAATKGNPGLSAAGLLIVDGTHTIERTVELGQMDNHSAEFAAAIAGLELLLEQGYAGQNVSLFSDSQVLIDALGKGYSKHHAAALERLQELADNFPLLIPSWQSDRVNKGAHTLALRRLNEIERKDG